MACKLVRAIVIKWYKILSYVGSDAIKQLLEYVNGIKLTKLTNERVPLKIKYKTCLIVKYTQQIS